MWSLYVTLIWILDIDRYRTDPQNFHKDGVPRWRRFRQLASRVKVKNFREMGEYHPEKRASAAQILLKFWDGEGLTTPRVSIKPLPQAANSDTTSSTSRKRTAPSPGPNEDGGIQKSRRLNDGQHRASSQRRDLKWNRQGTHFPWDSSEKVKRVGCTGQRSNGRIFL